MLVSSNDICGESHTKWRIFNDYHLLAVAGCDHVYNLLLDVHSAVAAELGALPDLGSGVGVGGVSLARAAHHALSNGIFCKICLENISHLSHLVTRCDIHSAVIRGALEEHQFPLFDFLLEFLLFPHGSPVALVSRHPVDPVAHQVVQLVQVAVVVIHPQGPLVLLLKELARVPEV